MRFLHKEQGILAGIGGLGDFLKFRPFIPTLLGSGLAGLGIASCELQIRNRQIGESQIRMDGCMCFCRAAA
jgi:hypothetical protein